MIIHPTYVGCDISQGAIDICDPLQVKPWRIANEPCAIAKFAETLQERQTIVVLEATGIYDRALRAGLAAAGTSFVRVNPTRARRFAQAAGLLAKTDKIDARMLSLMGESMKLKPDLPEDPEVKALMDLQVRRDQLVQMCSDEKRHLHSAEDLVAPSILRLITTIEEEITKLDSLIEALICSCEALKQTYDLLRSAPGIGPVAANVLTAQMPELGRLSPKKIAALAGLAPMNQDSGAMRGVRRIKGGRSRVRRALYMAAMAAARSCVRLSQFYQRIKQRAKSVKVAIIATARKLLTNLNAMLRDNQRYNAACN